jgi:uncharacterized protein with FMN-binding domain
MTVKRGPFAFAAAAAGFVVALGFHASGSSTALTPRLSTPRSGQSAPATTVASAKARPNTAPPNTTARSSAAAQSHPVSTTKSVPKTSQSVTGSTYQYGYGQLAVRVTLTGAKITGLSVVGLQTAESYSQQIADQVIPMLRQEVLAAQSVQVNGISGATYTAEAYVSSIQSALNKLHFK